MKTLSRHFAALLACAVLTAGVPGIHPEIFERISSDSLTLSEFCGRIAAMRGPTSADQTFQTLRYEASEQMLYRDDTPVGRSFGNYRISDGKLQRKSDDGAYTWISAEDSAAVNGSILQNSDTGLIIQEPFQRARLIVKAKSAPDPHGASETVSGFMGLHVMQYASSKLAYQAYLAYQHDPDIEYVDAGRIYRAEGTSDKSFSAIDPEEISWGVSAIGADSYCEWLNETAETLPEIRVAVIDTGVYSSHLWMKNRIAGGGAGFVMASDGSYEDRHGHGTHCSGIIVSSTPENVKIVPIKALDDDGYGDSLEIFCAMMHAAEISVDVVNMSLGGEGESPLIEEAAAVLESEDIPVCVSAGNETSDLRFYHPASLQSCFVIGAVNKEMKITDFSNFGDTLDFVAPGFKINSADCSSPDATTPLSGTSMSAPFASAAMADLLSAYPDLTNSQISSFLRANAIDLGTPGFDRVYGWGMISLKDFCFSNQICPIPTVSVLGGNYDEAISIELSCSDPEAELYYTLDGSKPDPLNASRYFVPLQIVSSAEIRAIAVKNEIQSRELHEIYYIGGADPATVCTVVNGTLISYHGSETDLHLDELFPGNALTAIGASAFKENQNIVSVSLPDSVTEIGSCAFQSCTHLVSVVGNGLRKIGSQAFDGCDSLQELHAAGLTEIGRGVFRNCIRLDHISDLLDPGVSVIPPYAFSGCSSLTALNLGKITEVGKNAFSACESLFSFGPDFSWKTLRVIGSSAFQKTKISGCVSLDSLESAGSKAFSETDIFELILPDSISEIPEGFAYHADSLYAVTAAHAVSIGADAFSRSVPSDLVLYADCSAVTTIGRAAFQNVRFTEPLSFDSLRILEKDSFSGTDGISLAFPAVEQLQNNAVQNSSVSVFYFSGCETIGENALSGSCGAVFSKKAVQIAPRAFGNAFLAAPEDSAVYLYAQSNHLPLYRMPSLLSLDQVVTVRQGEQAGLCAIPLGFGNFEIRWYKVNPDQTEPISDFGFCTLPVSTDTPGVYRYRAELSEYDSVISSVDYSVTVLSDSMASASSVLKTDQTELICWVDQKADMNGQYSAEFSFSADKTEKLMLYLSNAVCSVRISGTNGLSLQLDALNADDCFPIPVLKGTAYRLILSLDDKEADDRHFLYSAVRLSGDRLKHLTEESFSFDLSNDGIFPFHKTHIEPELVNPEYTTGQGIEKLTNSDYILRCVNNTSAGNGTVCIFGNGGFWGYQSTPFSIIGIIESDSEAVTENLAPDESCIFSFTPEETGYYCIYADFPETAVQNEIQKNVYEASFWDCKAELTVLSAPSLSERSAVSDSFSGLPSISVYLNEQTEYQIRLTNHGTSTIKALCVKAEKDKNTFGEIVFSIDDAIPYVADGRPVLPDLIQSGDLTLQKDQDYTAEVYFNDQPGTMLVLFRGCGEYRGSAIQIHDLCGIIRENEVISLHEGFLRNGFCYQFVPQNTGTYLFYTDFSQESLTKEIQSGVYHASFYAVRQFPLSLSDSQNLTSGALASSMQYLPGNFPLLSAELKAGRTYYISSDHALPDGIHDLCLTVACQQRHIATAVVDAPESYRLTDSPIEPAIVLYDGTDLLTEGVDYTVQSYSDPSAGILCSVITGIGRYCGRNYITAEIKDSHQTGAIELNTAFPFTKLTGDFHFTLAGISELELASDDGLDIEYEAYISHQDEDKTFSFDNGMLTLPPGNYILHLAQNQEFSRSLILKGTMPDSVSLSDCLLNTLPVHEDGSPKHPTIQVYDAGKLLTEGEHFNILPYGRIVNPGIYQITVRGCGKYTGEAQISFCVLPAGTDEKRSVLEGENSVQISVAGESVFYQWIPEHEQFCFSSSCIKHKRISIIDPNKGIVAELNGIGDQVVEFKPERNHVYWISAAFSYAEETGILSFRVDSDYRMLSDCDIIYEKMIQKNQFITRTVPKYNIRYQDEPLQEGIDFTVEYIGGETHCGKAVASFIGIGRYRGSLQIEYDIYPASPEEYQRLYPDLSDKNLELICSEPAGITTKHPGYSVCFSFTAPLKGEKRYRIIYPDGDFTVFVYGPQGNLLSLNQGAVVLEEGQTIQILCITSWLEIDNEFNQDYTISVIEDELFYDENTGLTFRTEQDRVYISAFHQDNRAGIALQDLVTDPETGKVYRLAGTDESFSGDLRNVIVYCEPGSESEQIIRSNGWCAAYPEFRFQEKGDVTGDGRVNEDDVRTLMRCLTESRGMQMCIAAQQASDYNSDGILDISDVHAILISIPLSSIG